MKNPTHGSVPFLPVSLEAILAHVALSQYLVFEVPDIPKRRKTDKEEKQAVIRYEYVPGPCLMACESPSEGEYSST